MLIKSDGSHLASVDPKDLLDAGLSPLALLTTRSNVTVDEGVIRQLIQEGKSRAANTSKYKPNSESVVKTKSKQVNTRSIPSSDPASEHVRDVPSENVISSSDDSDKLTTWLEFHSTPKDRRGLPLYYLIVDHDDTDILAETRQRCIDNVAQRVASNKPNLAKAGKGYKRKGKSKKPKYQLSRGEVLNFSDPYVKEIWERHLQRLGVDRYIASAEAEHHEMQRFEQARRLEAFIESQAVTQAANDPDITAEPATEYKMTPSGTESALLEQSVVDRDPPNAYTIQEMASDQDIWRYCNYFVFGPGQLQRDYPIEEAVTETEDVGYGYPEPRVMSESQRYFNFLRYRTWYSAFYRDVYAKRLEETDPLQNRRSRLSGETVPVPYQTGGSYYTDWLESVQAKQHEQGTTRPFKCFKYWSKYVENKYGNTGSVKVNYIDQDTFVERMKIYNETSYCVFKYIEDMHGGSWQIVDYCDSYTHKTKEQCSASFKEFVDAEQAIPAVAGVRLRKDFMSFRMLSNNVEVQRRKSTNTFRVATTTDLNGTYMIEYQYPELDRSQGAFAMFDAIAKGIEERAGVNREHVSDGSPDMTTSNPEVIGPTVNVKPTEVDSSPLVEGGGNVIPIQRARDWNTRSSETAATAIMGGIFKMTDIISAFENLNAHEMEEILNELHRIKDEA